MAWDDVVDSSSCITPTEWNNMITVIKDLSASSECPEKSEVTFYMYSDCSNSTGQKFKFDFLNDDSLMYGGSTAGDDLFIYVNSVDLCPRLEFFGDSDASLKIPFAADFYISTCSNEALLKVNKDGIWFKGDAVCTAPCGSDYSCPEKGDLPFVMYSDCSNSTGEKFKFDFLGDDSLLYGGGTTGDDLFIYANSADECPVLELFGNSGASLLIKAGSDFAISTCSNEMLFEVSSVSASKHINFHCLEAFEFRLELRTTDPSSPTGQGRIWFRADLAK